MAGGFPALGSHSRGMGGDPRKGDTIQNGSGGGIAISMEVLKDLSLK